MKYRLIDHRKLKYCSNFLLDIYELTNQENEFIYGCVPNGELGITLIFSGESFVEHKGVLIKQANASVYGLIKKRQFIKISKNYREITIGFQPHIFQLLIKDSMSSLLKNQCTDLNYLFDKYEVEKLYSKIQNAKDDCDILKGIELFLINNIKIDINDKRIVEANSLIFNDDVWSVNELSNKLQISEVWLRNLFYDKIGLSPKEMIKIARIKKALQYKFVDEESLTSLAYKLNYFDQSHFIHEFKEAIGLTPKKYFSNKKLTFDFYNFERWRFDSFEDTIL